MFDTWKVKDNKRSIEEKRTMLSNKVIFEFQHDETALPYFEILPGSLLANKRYQQLSRRDQGDFLRLIMFMWLEKCRIANYAELLAKNLGMEPVEWKELAARLLKAKLLVLSPDGLYLVSPDCQSDKCGRRNTFNFGKNKTVIFSHPAQSHAFVVNPLLVLTGLFCQTYFAESIFSRANFFQILPGTEYRFGYSATTLQGIVSRSIFKDAPSSRNASVSDVGNVPCIRIIILPGSTMQTSAIPVPDAEKVAIGVSNSRAVPSNFMIRSNGFFPLLNFLTCFSARSNSSLDTVISNAMGCSPLKWIVVQVVKIDVVPGIRESSRS